MRSIMPRRLRLSEESVHGKISDGEQPKDTGANRQHGGGRRSTTVWLTIIQWDKRLKEWGE